MNVKSVEKEAVRAKVTVEISRTELEPAINKVYLKVRKDITMPGFRKGKAPRMITLGGDLDGCDILTQGFSSVADYADFYAFLSARGYDERLLDRLFFTNLFALF